MTPQEILNAVVTHVRQQGRPAIRQGHGCVYFDPHTGNRCAIGALFNEEERAAALDTPGATIASLLYCRKEPTPFRGMFHENITLLQGLQHAHDNTASSSNKEWRYQFDFAVENIARTCELTVPKIEWSPL